MICFITATVLNSLFRLSPEGSFQLFHRIPKVLFKVDYRVIFHNNPFIFQKLLHGGRRMKVDFTRQQSISVDDPVCRNERFLLVRIVEGPANHAGRQSGAQVARDGPRNSSPCREELSGLNHILFRKNRS